MKKVSEILSRYFDTHGVHEGDRFADFFASWQEIAGPGLCDHTQVVDIKNGMAIVNVDHPGWMQKLSFQKQRILERLQKRYPELQITNVLMKCVPTEQMGKPSVEFQRNQLTKEMEQKRREQREAYEKQTEKQTERQTERQTEKLTKESKTNNSKDHDSTQDQESKDPEFLSLLKRIEKLSE